LIFFIFVVYASLFCRFLFFVCQKNNIYSIEILTFFLYNGKYNLRLAAVETAVKKYGNICEEMRVVF